MQNTIVSLYKDVSILATNDTNLMPLFVKIRVIRDKFQLNHTIGPVDDDFAAADVVVRRKMRWPCSGGQPMETVGAIATFDEGTGKFTIYANSYAAPV